ncbi:unnamed protein product [Rotaria sp. Silwood1]|nr:unnamed protein product [Rotaria sp. Silwood1]CAF3428129.1 unnamed protein product [Rotaria sp. Silwood1]CAF4536194.1 unnamed protein product [Rotaria sp. Silwood1]CAF4916586.1 unnamed protein product [Rotaria sp. Silwood1]
MAVEGIKTAQKANVSISVSAFLLTEQGRPKTSIASYSFSKERSATTDTRRLIDNGQYPIDIIQRLSSSTCRIIPNWEKAAHHIIFSTQTNNGNHQRSLSSKRNISTQTIIGDVRQPALLEAYQPLVTTDTIVQRSHNHKRRREKKKADEIKQVVNKDPSPSTIVTTDIPSINRHPFNCVCDAYGTIFKALCGGLQLECRKVSGYAKDYGYIPGKSTFNRTDHAWNVI